MNWTHGLHQVEEDGEEDDDDHHHRHHRQHEHEQEDDKERLVESGSTGGEFEFSFERETHCSKRFPRRRGRLDKAEEAE
ncbi:uncharacterized protein LOC143375194 isoform X1 [Andrena cerasifolii]|uniref:uncharacterized protein LOC143375194 isoform X1 n=1 Tax=Andrena cerasifolii TaxID=2819439 RepID=UPI004037E77A